MNRKEMKQLLEERFERIALLETRIDTMEQLIEGYHAREQSLIDTLHTAQNTSRKLTEDARAEADVAPSAAPPVAISPCPSSPLSAPATPFSVNVKVSWIYPTIIASTALE